MKWKITPEIDAAALKVYQKSFVRFVEERDSRVALFIAARAIIHERKRCDRLAKKFHASPEFAAAIRGEHP